MCGIFAYLNFNVNRERRYILEVLFNGLRRLEYRGYDSAGISIDATSASAPAPLVFRQEGNIESLVKSVYHDVAATDLNLEQSFSVHAGIAHTRWATHGEPAPRNSHPQTSGAGNDFLVVHNGVVTNYEALKETLIRHDFTFESETDTEVIPKLAKFVFDKANEEGDESVTFSQVVLEVMRHLEGAYALIFKSRHYPNELIACKRGSPLVLGVKDFEEEAAIGASFSDPKFPSSNGQPKELFLSSDANALVEHTKKVLVIEDGEVIHIKGLADGIIAALSKRKEEEELVSELTRTDIIKCIQSERVRFRGVNLSGLDLSKLDLSFVDFSYACLKNVFFSRANLQCAKFKDVDAEASIFHNATLRECEFTGANLRGALLAGANLQSANLQDACLIDCSFCGADLRSAHLQTADLTNANLEGANLEGANLKGAKLTNANLKGANLQRAYLRHVNLRDTHLEGAKLDGANLLGAIR